MGEKQEDFGREDVGGGLCPAGGNRIEFDRLGDDGQAIICGIRQSFSFLDLALNDRSLTRLWPLRLRGVRHPYSGNNKTEDGVEDKQNCRRARPKDAISHGKLLIRGQMFYN